jgi:hypothetical protein
MDSIFELLDWPCKTAVHLGSVEKLDRTILNLAYLLKIQWSRPVKQNISGSCRAFQTFAALTLEEIAFAELILAIAVRKVCVDVRYQDLLSFLNIAQWHHLDLAGYSFGVLPCIADPDDSVVFAAVVQRGGEWMQN